MATHEYRIMVVFDGYAIAQEMARFDCIVEAKHILRVWTKNVHGVEKAYIEKRTIGDWEEMNQEGGQP